MSNGHRERGAVAVMVGLLMIPLLVITAFGLDFGNAFAQRRALSTGADSGALAIIVQKRAQMIANPTLTCANVVAGDPGFAAAKATALASVNANAPFGRTIQASEVNASLSCSGTILKADVDVSTQVKTSLGGLVGVSSIGVERPAQAALDVGGHSKCGLCIVGPGDHNLQNGSITVNQSGVTINGTIDANPQGTIAITTTGSDVITLQGPMPSKGTYVPAPLVNQPPIKDPLAGLVLPPDMSALVVKTTNPCTGGPGIYLGDWDATDPCTLPTGLYVFAGTFDLKNRTVNANGATMYFTCKTTTTPVSIRPCNSSGEVGGSLQQAGNGEFKFTAPTSGPTAGLAVVADRNNTATFSYRGTSNQTSTGTIYIKNGTLDFRGTSGTTSLNSLIVTGNVSFSGQAPVVVNYSDNLNAPVPPTSLGLTE